MLKKLIIMVVFFLILHHSVPICGQESVYYEDVKRSGKVALNADMGFTLGPDAFLMSPGADFFLSEGLSIGPLIQFGVNDNTIFLSAECNLKFQFDIDSQDFWKRFKPFVQMGAGIAMVNVNLPAANDETDVGALVNMGFGFYIFVNSKMALGNNMLFNIITPAVEERLIFSWHFLSFKYLI